MNNDHLFPTSPRQGEYRVPYQPTSATSKAAAERVMPHLWRMTREVLEVYAEMRTRGATRDRISVYGKIPIQTVTSRTNRLIRIGALEVTDEKRPTSSGYMAEVVRITPAGAAMLAGSQGE